MNKNFESASEISSYSQVPCFRRRWLFVATAMTFAPAGIYLLLSGPVYAVHQGGIVRYRQKAARQVALFLFFYMILGLIRLLLQ